MVATLSVVALCGAAFAQEAPSDAVVAISAALRVQQFERAATMCAAALKATPGDFRLWTLQGIAQGSRHDPVHAMQSFQHALRLRPDYYPALAGAAQTSFGEQSPEARTLLQRALAVHPDDQRMQAMVGLLDAKANDCKAAADAFSHARDAIANQPQALRADSACLVKLGRYEESIPVLQAMLALQPNDANAVYNVALAESYAGHNGEALTTLEPLLSADAPSADVLALGASAAEAQGQTQRALDLLRKAILLYPKDQGPYLDYVNLAYAHGSPKVGLDIVNLGIQQIPQSGQLYFARGVLLCELGRVDEGLADFSHANQLDPKLAQVGVAEGIAQSQSHQSAAAVAQFRAEVKQHPDDALAWYLLAEALSEQGYGKGTTGFAEAVLAAKNAVRLDQKRVEAEDLLASLYLQADDPQSAIAASRAALAVDGQDPQALYHLILAMRKTDQKAELPELVKRLMAARHAAEVKTEKSRPHILVESGSAASAAQ